MILRYLIHMITILAMKFLAISYYSYVIVCWVLASTHSQSAFLRFLTFIVLIVSEVTAIASGSSCMLLMCKSPRLAIVKTK
jgi:hypothetical protein